MLKLILRIECLLFGHDFHGRKRKYLTCKICGHVRPKAAIRKDPQEVKSTGPKGNQEH